MRPICSSCVGILLLLSTWTTMLLAKKGDDLLAYQKDFLRVAIDYQALKFGSFTLKSGRQSPYFFNAGLFNTGKAASQVATAYAETIVRSDVQYDLIFGPAYKGIPLAATVSAKLHELYNIDIPYAYNRKEEKDHGEGGVLVGAPITEGMRVLVLDDVVTAGTAVRETVKIIEGKKAKVSGLVIALDRQEVGADKQKTATLALQEEFGFSVFSIVNISQLLEFSEENQTLVGGPAMVQKIAAYRNEWSLNQ